MRKRYPLSIFLIAIIFIAVLISTFYLGKYMKTVEPLSFSATYYPNEDTLTLTISNRRQMLIASTIDVRSLERLINQTTEKLEAGETRTVNLTLTEVPESIDIKGVGFASRSKPEIVFSKQEIEKGTLKIKQELLKNITQLEKEEPEKEVSIIAILEEPKAKTQGKVEKVSSIYLNSKVVHKYKYISSLAIKAPAKEIKRIAALREVKEIRPDEEVEVFLNDSVPIIEADKVWALLINDTNITGKGIKICIVDTGIDKTHPDLTGRVIAETDFTGEGPEDLFGHGTHCAGIAAGSGNASNKTLTGVAPEALILNSKFLDSSGRGKMSDAMAAWEWCAENGADLTTNSWGSRNNCNGSEPICLLAQNLVDSGILMIAAAGNSGPDYRTVGTPACCPAVLAVGATDKRDKIAWFSSRGPTLDGRTKPDVVAPGVSICSAKARYGRMGTPCFSDNYVSASGTSMATPHAAGLAALAMQAVQLKFGKSASPYAIWEVMTLTAKDLGYDNNTQGFGRIQAVEAIKNIYPGECVRGNPSINIKPISRIGFPGSNHSYTLEIKSGDNIFCPLTNFSIEVEVPEGWNYSISQSKVTLRGQRFTTLTLYIFSSPTSELKDYIFNVSVYNEEEPLYKGEAQAIFKVAPCERKSPQITLITANLKSPPGKSRENKIWVENQDSDACIYPTAFGLKAEVPEGWNYSFSPSELIVPINGKNETKFNLTVSETALPGNYTIKIIAFNLEEPIYNATYSMMFKVLNCTREFPSVFVTPDVQKGARNVITSYTVEIKNNDATTCDPSIFGIDVEVPVNWEFSSPRLIEITPNSSAKVSIKVKPPLSAELKNYTIQVKAFNQEAKEFEQKVSTTLQVVEISSPPKPILLYPANDSLYSVSYPILGPDFTPTFKWSLSSFKAVSAKEISPVKLDLNFTELRTLTENDTIEVIIQLKDIKARNIDELKSYAQTSQSRVVHLLEERGEKILNRFWLINALLAEIKVSTLPEILELEEVESVYENFRVNITLHEEREETVVSAGNYTWGLEMIRAPDVWKDFGIRGHGVRVCVIDTGVDISHPDLAGKMWSDDISDPTYPGGWAAFNSKGEIIKDSKPHDTHWHGTHVSGTVLGGDASGIAIGVAPAAWLMHALALPGGSGTFAQVVAAMQWCIDPFDQYGNPRGKKANILSMSFGIDGHHWQFNKIIGNIVSAGAIPVAAIGNSGEGVSSSPGNIYQTFGIGAVDSYGKVALFSGGEIIDDPYMHPEPYIKPDFSAPGVNVYSSIPDNKWRYASGTSMATPHVAGAIALLLEAQPALEINEIYDILRSTSVDKGETGKDIRYGWGIINIYEAVKEVVWNSSIEGYVIDSKTNKGIENAKVIIDDRYVVSRENGYFKIHLPPGDYELEANSFGYYPNRTFAKVLENQTTKVEIFLTPKPVGYVRGKITDIYKEPIKGVEIKIFDTPLSNITDENGKYTVKLPVGDYNLSASKWGYIPASFSVTIKENETYPLDLELWPTLKVFVMGFSEGQQAISKLLNETGINNEIDRWDELRRLKVENFDAVIVSEDVIVFPRNIYGFFENLLEDSRRTGTGLIFNNGGILALSSKFKDPKLPSGINLTFDQGYYFYNLLNPHFIFKEWNVGEDIVFKTTYVPGLKAVSIYPYFEEYSGEVLARWKGYKDGLRGNAIAYKDLGSYKHLLITEIFEVTENQLMDYGKMLILRGIGWVSRSSYITYRLQLAEDLQFSNVVYETDGIVGNLFKLPPHLLLESGKTYYWRVRSEFSDKVSEWSEPYQFTLIPYYNVSLSVSPNSGSVIPGENISVIVTASLITPKGGHASHFYCQNLPPGTSCIFKPEYCYPNCSSTLTIQTSSTTPEGNYKIKILGKTTLLNYYIKGTTFDLTVASKCVRLNPSIFITPTQIGFPGSILNYSVTVENKDSSLCGASIFNLTSECPSGWSCYFDLPSLRIEAGSSNSTLFRVEIPSYASVGTYEISLTVINSENATYYSTESIKVPITLYLINGVIEDVIGNRIGNVKLILRNETHDIEEEFSNETGHYSISVPKRGNYTLILLKLGFVEEKINISVQKEFCWKFKEEKCVEMRPKMEFNLISDLGMIPERVDDYYLLKAVYLWYREKIGDKKLMDVISRWKR